MASNAVEIVKPSLPHMTSVERLSKFPVVEQTVDLASNLYGRVKDVNPIVNTVLSTAETTVKGAVGKTLPVASRLEGPIKMVDSILCSSLDFVETNLPVVKLPADEMYKSTRDYVFGLPGVQCACQLGQQGVRRAVECACAVSEYSTVKLNGLKDSLAVQEDSKSTDTRALFTVYLFSLLNILTILSAWVGLGQCPKSDSPRKPKNLKPKQNGNSPTQNHGAADEGEQHNHENDNQ